MSRARQRRIVVSLTPISTASSAAGRDDCRIYARCLGVVVALACRQISFRASVARESDRVRTVVIPVNNGSS